jgi:DNA-binding NtrC family response regulator
VNRTLFVSWVGNSDLEIGRIGKKGPIFDVVRHSHQTGRSYSEVWLLDDTPGGVGADQPRNSPAPDDPERKPVSLNEFKESLQGLCGEVTIRPAGLTNPVQQFERAYNFAFDQLKIALNGGFDRVDLGLSSGTWVLQCALLMASSRYVGPLRRLMSRIVDNEVEELALPVPLGRLWDGQEEPSVLAHVSDPAGWARAEIEKLDRFCQDAAMLNTAGQLLRVAKSEHSIAVYGPTGAGKELFAKLIHAGSRRTGKIVSENCAAIPENLFEAILFGTVKGAFTGADDTQGKFLQSNKGTLFLDEIGELSLDQQSKLLRVVEERKITKVGAKDETEWSGRLVIATNRDLLTMVKEGKFREDLYYRLTTFEFTVPELRKRTDLVGLALFLLAKASGKIRERSAPLLEADAVELLKRHPWPGNVRELTRAMIRAVQYANPGAKSISRAVLAQAIGTPTDSDAAVEPPGGPSLALSPLPIDWKAERTSLLARAEDFYLAELAEERDSAAARQLGLTAQGVKDMRKRANRRQPGAPAKT